MRFIKPACSYKVWFTKLSIFYKVEFIDPAVFTALSCKTGLGLWVYCGIVRKRVVWYGFCS